MQVHFGGEIGGAGILGQLVSHLAPKALDPNNWSGGNKQVAYTIRNAPGANQQQD
jgi:hypothetical protein